MIRILWFFGILLLGSLCLAHSPAASPSPVAGERSPAQTISVPSSPANWQQNWENILAAAKKEGAVSVYGSWRPEIRTSLTNAFKKKFGINVEFTPFSREADLIAKVQLENRAGIYSADVFGVGAPTLVVGLKTASLLASIEPFLLLPDVTDTRNWTNGRFLFMDKDKSGISMVSTINRYIMYNVNLIKAGEITSYKDLLKPQYQGKITLDDPTVTGSGNGLMGFLALRVWNKEETKDFLRQLIKRQNAFIQRDKRLLGESVVRGKFAIGVGVNLEFMAELLKTGAPIDVAIVKEGTFVVTGSGGLGVPVKLAHPNAAKLFINWLLTKEGQTIFSQSIGTISLRTDVTPKGIPSAFLPQPGEKLFLDSEEDIIFRGEMRNIAKEVIGAP